jgi:UDP-N-acetylmuramoylalanine--D-glutamate ligase
VNPVVEASVHPLAVLHASLQGATVLVLGLGASGLAMARWTARHGARVRVWDSRETPPNAEALKAELPEATLSTGDIADVGRMLDGVQMVLKSPGLAPTHASIAGLLNAARQRGLSVHGELDLFNGGLASLAHERGYAPQVVAITGTNGKTTTTALTALLIERAGRRVATAGNIGPSMLDTLTSACLTQDDETSWPQAWVLELSSFQLDGAAHFEPAAATVLNVTQDHLDWHGTMEAYASAKAKIFGAHTVMVLNRDDDAVEAMAPSLKVGAAVKGLRGKKKDKVSTQTVVRFGLDSPRAAGDFGLVTEGGMAWLVRAMDDSAGGHRHDSDVLINRLMPVDAMRLRGRHNASNALAALALATAIGCPLGPMLHGLREYRGEPHRVEPVAIIDGVEAFDDSKGTNVGATVAAIEGLGADRAPAKLIVILGGDGKGQDFAPLRAPVARHVRAVAFIGRDADAIATTLADVDVTKSRHDTLEAATRWCFTQAQSGDAVLLSPACASLDMFRNYAHRAEVFAAEVQTLASAHGEVSA